MGLDSSSRTASTNSSHRRSAAGSRSTSPTAPTRSASTASSTRSSAASSRSRTARRSGRASPGPPWGGAGPSSFATQRSKRPLVARCVPAACRPLLSVTEPLLGFSVAGASQRPTSTTRTSLAGPPRRPRRSRLLYDMGSSRSASRPRDCLGYRRVRDGGLRLARRLPPLGAQDEALLAPLLRAPTAAPPATRFWAPATCRRWSPRASPLAAAPAPVSALPHPRLRGEGDRRDPPAAA